MTTLTHKGFVESTVGSADRRTTLLSLTPAGVDGQPRVTQIEQNLYGAITLILDDDQVAAVLPN